MYYSDDYCHGYEGITEDKHIILTKENIEFEMPEELYDKKELAENKSPKSLLVAGVAAITFIVLVVGLIIWNKQANTKDQPATASDATATATDADDLATQTDERIVEL